MNNNNINITKVVIPHVIPFNFHLIVDVDNFVFRLRKNWIDEQLNRMEEEISLLNQYQEYHTNNASGIKEESLVKQSRDFLTTVKPEDRFVHLNVDFYRNVLGIIAQKYDINEESIQKINTGFKSLEKYAVNLWKFPWRKEYHTIKVCTGYV